MAKCFSLYMLQKAKHFAIRPLEEVLEDFRIARGVYRRVDRVFLADGDALVRKANELYTILDTIRELFPECERVTSYASLPPSVSGRRRRCGRCGTRS